MAQLFPGLVLGLFSKRATISGVFAGVFTGIAIVAILMLTRSDPYYGLNSGFIVLCFNSPVTGVVSLRTPMRVAGFDEALTPVAASQSGSG